MKLDWNKTFLSSALVGLLLDGVAGLDVAAQALELREQNMDAALSQTDKGTGTHSPTRSLPDSVGVVLPCIELQGEIYTQFVDSKEKIMGTITNTFVVAMNHERTKIEIDSSGPEISGIEYGLIENGSYTLVRYDTNRVITQFSKLVDGKIVNQKLDKPQNPVNDAMIILNDGEVPEYGYGISPLWMAYCMGRTLSHTNEVEQMEPVFPFGRKGNDYRMKGGHSIVRYTFPSAKSLSPETLTETIAITQKSASGITSPSSEGVFTNAICKVTGWTHISEVGLPTRFAVTHFFTEDVGGGKVVYEGVVKAVLKRDSIPDLQIPMNTSVSEKRTAWVGPLKKFTYVTTNGLLMNKQDLQSTEQFTIKVNEKSVKTSSNRILRRGIIVSLVLILFTVLATRMKRTP